MLVKLCFSLHFKPLDPVPDPRTQMNADPTGSGSTSLYIVQSLRKIRIRILDKNNGFGQIRFLLEGQTQIRVKSIWIRNFVKQ